MSNDKKFIIVGLKDKLSDEPVMPFGRVYESNDTLKRDFKQLFKDNPIRDDLEVYLLGFYNTAEFFINAPGGKQLLFVIGELFNE